MAFRKTSLVGILGIALAGCAYQSPQTAKTNALPIAEGKQERKTLPYQYEEIKGINDNYVSVKLDDNFTFKVGDTILNRNVIVPSRLISSKNRKKLTIDGKDVYFDSTKTQYGLVNLVYNPKTERLEINKGDSPNIARSVYGPASLEDEVKKGQFGVIQTHNVKESKIDLKTMALAGMTFYRLISEAPDLPGSDRIIFVDISKARKIDEEISINGKANSEASIQGYTYGIVPVEIVKMPEKAQEQEDPYPNEVTAKSFRQPVITTQPSYILPSLSPSTKPSK